MLKLKRSLCLLLFSFVFLVEVSTQNSWPSYAGNLQRTNQAIYSGFPINSEGNYTFKTQWNNLLRKDKAASHVRVLVGKNHVYTITGRNKQRLEMTRLQNGGIPLVVWSNPMAVAVHPTQPYHCRVTQSRQKTFWELTCTDEDRKQIFTKTIKSPNNYVPRIEFLGPSTLLVDYGFTKGVGRNFTLLTWNSEANIGGTGHKECSNTGLPFMVSKENEWAVDQESSTISIHTFGRTGTLDTYRLLRDACSFNRTRRLNLLPHARFGSSSKHPLFGQPHVVVKYSPNKQIIVLYSGAVISFHPTSELQNWKLDTLPAPLGEVSLSGLGDSSTTSIYVRHQQGIDRVTFNPTGFVTKRIFTLPVSNSFSIGKVFPNTTTEYIYACVNKAIQVRDQDGRIAYSSKHFFLSCWKPIVTAEGQVIIAGRSKDTRKKLTRFHFKFNSKRHGQPKKKVKYPVVSQILALQVTPSNGVSQQALDNKVTNDMTSDSWSRSPFFITSIITLFTIFYHLYVQ